MSCDVIRIFENPPPPPCSHVLRVDAADTFGVFKALVTILKAGMAVLHSTADGVVDLSAITASDVRRLQEYFRAFCVEMNVGSPAAPGESGDSLSSYSVLIRMPSETIRISFSYMVPDIQPPRFF